MKYNSRFAQLAFESGFSMPMARGPKVRATELDAEIILEWDPVNQTPNNSQLGYELEGYVCYQLSSENPQSAQAKVLATFDRVNGVQEILDLQYVPELGLVATVPVKKGTDSGLRRSLRITKDAFSGDPLRNGKKYYFAVSAYTHGTNPDFPKMFESALIPIRATPGIPFGLNGFPEAGDTIAVSHIQGSGTGLVSPVVVNPLSSTGQAYEVRIDTSAGETVWSLENLTQGVAILTNQSLHTGPGEPPIVEGGVSLAVSGAHLAGDVFSYNLPSIDSSLSSKKQSARTVNVFPNPAIAVERVTFGHLPPKAVIRIFNLAGHLVRAVEKNDPSQFLYWDLTNGQGWRIASGIYLCYIEMPEVGETVLLKLAIVQEQIYPGSR